MKEFERTVNRSTVEYYQNRIGLEQEKLRDFFEIYLPNSFRPENVMNFCCGVANEEPVLFEMFGHDLKLTSFDMSERMLQLAMDYELERKSLIKLDLNEVNVYFKEEKFDLLIGRNIPINPNSNCWHTEKYPDHWPEHMSSLKEHLNDDGILLMTFARKDEFYRGVEILAELGFELVVKEKNQIEIPSDYIGIAGADVKDNFVILAKKIPAEVF